jgi:hypothetical protein
MQLDNSLDVRWEVESDTSGNTVINSLCRDAGGSIFVSGSYSGQVEFAGKNLSAGIHDPNAFVAKFSAAGNLAWLNDELTPQKTGVGAAIVCDRAGNTFTTVTTSFASFVTKLDADGSQQWLSTIRRNLTLYVNRMLISGTDIYICGEGYRAGFRRNETDEYAFCSQGGVDFFIARYSTAGFPSGLNIGGGPGDDYCRSIALQGPNVIAYGELGHGNYPFDKTKHELPRGGFWLASFGPKAFVVPEVFTPEQEIFVASNSLPSQFIGTGYPLYQPAKNFYPGVNLAQVAVPDSRALEGHPPMVAVPESASSLPDTSVRFLHLTSGYNYIGQSLPFDFRIWSIRSQKLSFLLPMAVFPEAKNIQPEMNAAPAVAEPAMKPQRKSTRPEIKLQATPTARDWKTGMLISGSILALAALFFFLALRRKTNK